MLDLHPRLETQARITTLIDRLAAAPPSALLLEGGTDQDRKALALYYAARLNCPAPAPPEQGAAASACLACPTCDQTAAKVHADLVFLGEDDEGVTGPVKIEAVREVRALMGQPPKGQGLRVVVLFEAQNLTMEAANCLLKSMEEPRPGTVFVLTAPQRERLLQTLVSRSFVLTLAWPAPDRIEDREEAARLGTELMRYWVTGRGWFTADRAQRIAADTAAHALAVCRRDIAKAVTGQAASLPGQMPAAALQRMAAAVDQAEEALDVRVNPSLVLDWLAVTARALAGASAK
jgi:DNA polymerase-3 subunit delta'